ncbi:MAG: hypothetical protein N2689_17175, partial [Verrucomicrobiae bacterium]|nr:hypothetical protein [Verrucomicrobiae bacterium]
CIRDRLQPGQSFTFEWQMRAPDTTAGVPDEAIAWNSFAYTSTNALTGVPPVEAMELVVERLKKTKSNAEFLLTMHT